MLQFVIGKFISLHDIYIYISQSIEISIIIWSSILPFLVPLFLIARISLFSNVNFRLLNAIYCSCRKAEAPRTQSPSPILVTLMARPVRADRISFDSFLASSAALRDSGADSRAHACTHESLPRSLEIPLPPPTPRQDAIVWSFRSLLAPQIFQLASNYRDASLEINNGPMHLSTGANLIAGEDNDR